MKKLLAIMLATVVLTGLAGCKGGSNSKKEIAVQDLNGETVTMSFDYEIPLEPGVNTYTDELIERIDAVEKKWNCKIDIVTTSQGEYYSSLMTNCLAGDPPGDIMNMEGRYVINYARAGIIQPLNNLQAYKNEIGNKLAIGAEEMLTVDGNVYGMGVEPWEGYNVITYNKRIFEENNLEDPYELAKAGKWDWDKFTEYAKATTVTSSSGKITQYGFYGDLFEIMASTIASNNGEIISCKDGKYEFKMDSANSIEALNQVEKWMHTDKIMNTEAVDWLLPVRMFEKGKVAMVMTPGIWMIEERFNVNCEDDYGVIYFPKGPKADDYVTLRSDGEYVTIPTATKFDPEVLTQIYTEVFLPEDFNAKTDIENEILKQYGNIFRDDGSEDVIVDLAVNHKDYTLLYMSLGLENSDLEFSLRPNFANNIAKGEKTVAQLLSEIKKPLQNYLDDNYNK